MGVHDWTRVPAGIFHDFHIGWILSIKTYLNSGMLPEGYYSLAEQHAGKFGPDVLTLQAPEGNGEERVHSSPRMRTATLSKPRKNPIAEGEMAFYLRKKNVVAIRHVSDDRIVAVVEIVSPGNKGGAEPIRAFVEKAAQILKQGVHMMVIDVLPPSPRDPQGMHGVIWDYWCGQVYTLPSDRPLTVASYEADFATRAYVEHFAVGGSIPEMPLFLEPDGCVETDLQATYDRAFQEVPKRWRDVLE